MKITTKKIDNRHKKYETMEVVLADGREIGLLIKSKNTRTEMHPWKAWRGIGHKAEYLGAYYADSFKGVCNDESQMRFGGKGAAIAEIVQHAKITDHLFEMLK